MNSFSSANDFYIQTDQLLLMFDFVSDEVDGFNFITCHTTDTFWSTAALLWKPFQSKVWIGIGVCLFLSACLVVNMKTFYRMAISPMKLLSFILFNLIEASVYPRNSALKRGGIKLFIASWLMVGIILTYSYKGLIISYLSAPWALNPEWNYFHEMKGFRFYCPFEGFGIEFWELCTNMKKHEWRKNSNESCFEVLKEHSAFGSRVVRFSASAYVWNNHYGINYTNLFARSVLVFPTNESSRVKNEVMSGVKVTMVGLNTEVEEIIAPMTLNNPIVPLGQASEKGIMFSCCLS